ncbi:MAG TPA: nucleotidyltransferase domain-containing protein [Solirubrobacter sp.]|nr:nucleotidyltransferase domain-containing protein [Solirubrobacter sp.]
MPDLTPSNAVHSLELDLTRAQEIAERGLILRTTVGSVVHGLSNLGTDDRDELGVCIEPPEYLLGFRRFEHFAYRTQPEGRPSGPGDLDLTVYGLRKYCRLALKGSPTTLLPLFVRGDDVIARTSAGEELQALAGAFVARSTGRAFRGYLDAQRRGLLGERHATRTRERSREHGYDTKYAMHALRIGYQGVELLETGRITLPVPEPQRTTLRAVRAGTVPLGEVLALIERVDAELDAAGETSGLPDTPDVDAVDRFAVRAYRAAWDARR